LLDYFGGQFEASFFLRKICWGSVGFEMQRISDLGAGSGWQHHVYRADVGE
jgi:hypothetical protein